MRYRTFLFMALAATLLALTTFSHATTMLLLSREELSLRSDIVARVRVGKATVTESDDGRKILTHTELRVTKLLKGKVTDSLVVQQWGGTWRGKTQKVLGDGQLRQGEDAVVFLRRDEQGKTYLTALALAVYHVDDRSNARRFLDDVSFVKYESGRPQGIAYVETPESVESLMTDIVRLSGGK